MESANLLLNHGLIYGLGSHILAWHPGLERPVTLKDRTDNSPGKGYVSALALFGGQLFDGSYSGLVRKTLTDETIGNTTKYHSRDANAILGLDVFRGKLIAVRQDCNLFMVEYGDGYTFHPGGRVYYVDNDSAIALLGEPRDANKSVEGYNRNSKNLQFRNYSLNLAVANGVIYVSSENVVAVHPRVDTNELRIDVLTPYMADKVHLVSNGNQAYSISNHNPHTYPDGAELRLMPDNKRVAFWKPSDDWWPRSSGPEFGYTQGATLVGDTLIFTTLKFNTPKFNTPKFNVYAVSITREMKDSMNGLPAEPKLLLKDADKFDIFGNPVIALPRADLERIIQESRAK